MRAWASSSRHCVHGVIRDGTGCVRDRAWTWVRLVGIASGQGEDEGVVCDLRRGTGHMRRERTQTCLVGVTSEGGEDAGALLFLRLVWRQRRRIG